MMRRSGCRPFVMDVSGPYYLACPVLSYTSRSVGDRGSDHGQWQLGERAWCVGRSGQADAGRPNLSPPNLNLSPGKGTRTCLLDAAPPSLPPLPPLPLTLAASSSLSSTKSPPTLCNSIRIIPKPAAQSLSSTSINRLDSRFANLRIPVALLLQTPVRQLPELLYIITSHPLHHSSFTSRTST